MPRLRTESALALALLLLVTLSARADLQLPTGTDLHPIGAGTLRWFGFHVYDASTWAIKAPLPSDGTLPAPFALQIVYARDISAADLVQATESSWQKLGLLDDRAKGWLPELATLWPDVKAGDCLVLFVDADGKAAFYYNRRLLGSIADGQFAERFAAIWLHPNSSEPALRQRLLGHSS